MECTFHECPLGALNDTVSVLDAALHYAELGFKVFPLSPMSKIPHHGLGYREDERGGSYWATDDVEQLREWFTDWPDANIAIATNELQVVDFDIPWSIALIGLETSEIIEHLPLDCVASTPQGGRHVFVQGISEVGNSVKKIAPGIDVKAKGGYVAAQPSRFMVQGEIMQYAWMTHPDTVPVAPDALLDVLRDRIRIEQQAAHVKAARDDLNTTPGSGMVVDPSTEGFRIGSRNEDAHKYACRLWRKNWGDEDYVWRKLHEAWQNTSQDTPFPWSEVVRSGNSAKRFISRDRDDTLNLAQMIRST